MPSQANYVDKNNLQRNLHIIEDSASECASGDIQEVIVKNLFEI
jgi:hypothetical protein